MAAYRRGSKGRAPLPLCRARASMGPSQKPNVCGRLSRRALGFFSRDAGMVQRTNLGILRALVCQVTACRPGGERRAAGRRGSGA